MFAGKIKMKNTIKSQAVITRNCGICSPNAPTISMIAVKYTSSFLKGKKLGIIISIPFVNIKCPIAVKSNIMVIPILTESGKLKLPFINFMEKPAIKKALIKTSKGFIFCLQSWSNNKRPAMNPS